MYKIGIQFRKYPEIRNILDKIDGALYVEKPSIRKNKKYTEFITRVIKKIERTLNIKHYFIKLVPHTIYAFKSNHLKDIDFFHFFNSILYGRNKWGVTFETLVPYVEQDIINVFLRDEKVTFNNKDAVRQVAKRNCKFIIAISQCSYNIQKEYLNYFPSYKKRILQKTFVLHPPQKLLIKKYIKPNLSEGINFMFVGSEFLCKGAIEILRAFSKIKDEYLNFNLILVGDFERTNGRCFISEEEVEAFKTLIKANPKRISYFRKMDNDKVLYYMKEVAHVGLLPTHADTYGYSVLEFQAAGCPVISTNIRSLPEINNEDCGWIINIPKSSLGEPYSRKKSELINVQNIIEHELKKIMVNIINKTEIIEPKAKKSLERIKKYHSEEEYSKKLLEIYNRKV